MKDKKSIIISLCCCLCLVSCNPDSVYWTQSFYNKTDSHIVFYINQFYENGIIYPCYNGLPSNKDMIEQRGQSSVTNPGYTYYELPWEVAIKKGDAMDVYAFDDEALKQLSWDEIRQKNKYWFKKPFHQAEAIQFPDGFEYMGNIDE